MQKIKACRYSVRILSVEATPLLPTTNGVPYGEDIDAFLKREIAKPIIRWKDSPQLGCEVLPNKCFYSSPTAHARERPAGNVLAIGEHSRAHPEQLARTIGAWNRTDGINLDLSFIYPEVSAIVQSFLRSPAPRRATSFLSMSGREQSTQCILSGLPTDHEHRLAIWRRRDSTGSSQS